MFSTILFYVLAVILVIAAGRVITVRSPITAVLHLILAFFTAAMMWISIGAEFLGLVLVIVYVGAVMVLFLFVVMMIDVVPETLRSNFRTYLPLGLLVGAVMVLEIAFVFGSSYLDSGAAQMPADGYNNSVALGVHMYTQYSFAIQIAAIILLVGMISAIAISYRGRKNGKYVPVSKQLKVHAKDRLRIVKMPSAQPQAAEPVSEEAEGEDKE
ncbi:NADH-quinone oxidoreductase subunit J [Brackiella oedipodis]|uniref:NADH-quinone oxidoreductase subunit J n=1 Tax=Brackiella oedipodis TaxID=124225 RepID=UPI000491F262|nr:NADH-quinone oxidoreductase subunit J [Brackiella oedipodis]